MSSNVRVSVRRIERRKPLLMLILSTSQNNTRPPKLTPRKRPRSGNSGTEWQLKPLDKLRQDWDGGGTAVASAR